MHGLADVYAQGNFNRPASGTTQLRAFDGQANQPALGMVRLTLAHRPGLFGFRLDVGAGDVANGYLRYDPASVDHPEVSRVLSYVEHAFVTARVPLGRGLLVDIGKFGTPVGIEDNEALGNWNDSRSLLYLLAEPSYHTGLRLTYALRDNLAVSLFWVNGWDTNVLDGNGMRGLGAAVPERRWTGDCSVTPACSADPRIASSSLWPRPRSSRLAPPRVRQGPAHLGRRTGRFIRRWITRTWGRRSGGSRAASRARGSCVTRARASRIAVARWARSAAEAVREQAEEARRSRNRSGNVRRALGWLA